MIRFEEHTIHCKPGYIHCGRRYIPSIDSAVSYFPHSGVVMVAASAVVVVTMVCAMHVAAAVLLLQLPTPTLAMLMVWMLPKNACWLRRFRFLEALTLTLLLPRWSLRHSRLNSRSCCSNDVAVVVDVVELVARQSTEHSRQLFRRSFWS